MDTGSESAYWAFFKHHPDPMWVFDPETLGFLEVNAAAIEKYGYSREEFLGLTLRDIHPEEDVPALLDIVDRLTDGMDEPGIWRHRLKSGAIVQVDIRARGIVFDDRRAKLVAARDVTRLLQFEQQRRQAETLARARSEQLTRRMRETLESISDAFFTLDTRWCFTFVNGEFTRILGRGRDELIGRTIWECFPEAARHGFRHECERAVATRQPVTFVDYYPPLEKWLSVKACPTPDGLAVYSRDITRERANEAALVINDERFRLVAKATNDVIWDWNFVSGTVWWNDNLRSLFGYDPATVEPGPESWVNRIHPEDRDRVLAGIHAAIDGDEVNWQDEYRFICVDGLAATVIDRGFVIRNEQGEAVRMLGSMIDVTRQRELDDRLRQSQKMEAIGQLTGGIAHDFNNLLTVILGNTELLCEQLPSSHPLRPLAEMAVTAAERGAELTHRLLAFARRQALDPQAVDINRLVTGMDNLLRRTLAENIDIELVRDGGLWPAEVDPGQLEVALLNLAINARDAMPEGGRLTIETANTRLDEEYAEEHKDVQPGQYVLVAVSDTGTGMLPEVATRVFEPFFTTKEVGRGSGLGLSMVYGFVKQSGGHVTIYTEAGEGTSIKIYLPRVDAGKGRVGMARVGASIVGGDEHILVVEDDALVCQHLTAQLRGLGYRVTSASAGQPALAILRQQPDIDLLFTDVVMPGGMNGRELADAARQLRPGLKVLFTSGYTANAIVHQGRLDREVQLLSKPYRRNELAAKVRKVLDGK